MDIDGQVQVGEMAVVGAAIIVSDEGIAIGGAVSDAQGRFVVSGLPAAGHVTVRAVHSDYGAAQSLVSLGDQSLSLSLSMTGCFGYLDLPDPRLLVTETFLESFDVPALQRSCPDCATYRWFWDREGLTPVVLRLDFTAEGVLSTVRLPDTAPGAAEGAWTEHTRLLSLKRAQRIDRAIGRSGYWQLEHHDTSGACDADDPGSAEWTLEAIAGPGYRAIYRLSPLGTPLAGLGYQWLRAVRLKVKRKDFR